MTDIIERLQKLRKRTVIGTIIDMLDDAVAEIERLRAENERLQLEIKRKKNFEIFVARWLFYKRPRPEHTPDLILDVIANHPIMNEYKTEP